MSDTEVIMDEVTVATGESETSAEIDVRNEPTLTLYVDGDANSDSLDITAEAKVRDVDSDSWAEHDASVSGEDLTATSNNASTFTYDVENVTELRFVVGNSGAAGTTVTAVSSVEQ